MKIPPLIHQIWLGPPMSDEYRRYAESWRAHHPGWQYRLWDEAALAELPMRNRSLYERADVEAPTDAVRWRVDVARLEILRNYGGIYVDADTLCLRPLDDLLARSMFLPQSPNAPEFVTNAVMGATEGHPFLDRLIRGLPDNAAKWRGKRLVDTVGGKYFTRRLGVLKPTDVTVLPWWLFAAQSIRDRDRGRVATPHPNAYCDHRYGHSLGRRRR